MAMVGLHGFRVSGFRACGRRFKAWDPKTPSPSPPQREIDGHWGRWSQYEGFHWEAQDSHARRPPAALWV